eukprot:5279734-Amphidinium_carterae.1
MTAAGGRGGASASPAAIAAAAAALSSAAWVAMSAASLSFAASNLAASMMASASRGGGAFCPCFGVARPCAAGGGVRGMPSALAAAGSCFPLSGVCANAVEMREARSGTGVDACIVQHLLHQALLLLLLLLLL